MPLQVECIAQYLSVWPSDRSTVPEKVYGAHWFVKAVKGDPFPRAVTIKYGSDPPVTLKTGSQPDAHRLVARWAVSLLAASAPKGTVLVPVPGSACALGSKTVGTADKIAAAVSKESGGKYPVVRAVRMDKVLKPAHKGGPRFPDQVYPHLRAAEPLPRGTQVVLVDDVLTSGGHLKACRAFVERQGARVAFALCAGRTFQTSVADPWNVGTQQLEDWSP